jgi:hypothetical protein
VKRLGVILFLLIVVAGVVFFFGWIQLRLDADEHAVLFSKTSGWEETVIAPGTFTWRWQRLIPTNLSIYEFSLQPTTTTVSLTGSLPSAANYAAIIDGPASFSYRLALDVSYRIRPDALPALARDEGLRPDTLAEFTSARGAQIGQAAKEAAFELLENSPSALNGPSAATTLATRVTSHLERRFPELEVVAVDARNIELPDLELYALARSRYTEVVDARAAALTEAARSVAVEQTRTETELELLERYGEILERYPVLLDYFRMGNEIGGDPLELQNLIPPTSQ